MTEAERKIAQKYGLSDEVLAEAETRGKTSGRSFLDVLMEDGRIPRDAVLNSETFVQPAAAAAPAAPSSGAARPSDARTAATQITPPPGFSGRSARTDGGQGPPAYVGTIRVIGKLGQGGMGTVYRGLDEALDRPVVIKVLAPHLAEREEFRARFQREAKAAARLDHPNIVTIYGVGEAQGLTYIVMQFVEGETLDNRIERDGPLPIPEAVRIIQDAARGVGEAHRLGIIHRDLKPANLIVTPRGDVKVLDFGLARMEDSRGLSQTGEVMGTLQYMPPEQAEGTKVDARADIYSLGATLYALLAGRPPYDGPSSASILKKVLLDRPPPLLTSRADLPPAIAAFVESCLEKDPEQRPRDTDDFIGLLGEAAEQAGLPVWERPRTGSGAGLKPPSGAGTRPGSGAGKPPSGVGVAPATEGAPAASGWAKPPSGTGKPPSGAGKPPSGASKIESAEARAEAAVASAGEAVAHAEVPPDRRPGASRLVGMMLAAVVVGAVTLAALFLFGTGGPAGGGGGGGTGGSSSGSGSGSGSGGGTPDPQVAELLRSFDAALAAGDVYGAEEIGDRLGSCLPTARKAAVLLAETRMHLEGGAAFLVVARAALDEAERAGAPRGEVETLRVEIGEAEARAIQEEIHGHIVAGEIDIARDELDHARRNRTIDDGAIRVLAGELGIADMDTLIARCRAHIADGHPERARTLVEQARSSNQLPADRIAALDTEVTDAQIERLMATFRQRIQDMEFEEAADILQQIRAFDRLDAEGVRSLREEVRRGEVMARLAQVRDLLEQNLVAEARAGLTEAIEKGANRFAPDQVVALRDAIDRAEGHAPQQPPQQPPPQPDAAAEFARAAQEVRDTDPLGPDWSSVHRAFLHRYDTWDAVLVVYRRLRETGREECRRDASAYAIGAAWREPALAQTPEVKESVRYSLEHEEAGRLVEFVATNYSHDPEWRTYLLDSSRQTANGILASNAQAILREARIALPVPEPLARALALLFSPTPRDTREFGAAIQTIEEMARAGTLDAGLDGWQVPEARDINQAYIFGIGIAGTEPAQEAVARYLVPRLRTVLEVVSRDPTARGSVTAAQILRRAGELALPPPQQPPPQQPPPQQPPPASPADTARLTRALATLFSNSILSNEQVQGAHREVQAMAADGTLPGALAAWPVPNLEEAYILRVSNTSPVAGPVRDTIAQRLFARIEAELRRVAASTSRGRAGAQDIIQRAEALRTGQGTPIEPPPQQPPPQAPPTPQSAAAAQRLAQQLAIVFGPDPIRNEAMQPAVDCIEGMARDGTLEAALAAWTVPPLDDVYLLRVGGRLGPGVISLRDAVARHLFPRVEAELRRVAALEGARGRAGAEDVIRRAEEMRRAPARETPPDAPPQTPQPPPGPGPQRSPRERLQEAIDVLFTRTIRYDREWQAACATVEDLNRQSTLASTLMLCTIPLIDSTNLVLRTSSPYSTQPARDCIARLLIRDVRVEQAIRRVANDTRADATARDGARDILRRAGLTP